MPDSVVWIPDNSGHVSCVQTSTGYELGRYKIAPDDLPGIPGSDRDGVYPPNYGTPSRVVVAPDGSCWVGNLSAGSVVKVGLLSNDGYIDRNHNGSADTCVDANADHLIRGSEILDWGDDECVLYEVVFSDTLPPSVQYPGIYSGAYDPDDVTGNSPAGLALDSKGDLWVGGGAADDVIVVSNSVKQALRRFWHIVGARDGAVPEAITVEGPYDLTANPSILTVPLTHAVYPDPGAGPVCVLDTTNWLPKGTVFVGTDTITYDGLAYDDGLACWVLSGTGGIFHDHTEGTIVYGPGHVTCGFVIDENGILWSAGRDGNNLVRFDTNSCTWSYVTLTHKCYGLALDGLGHLFVTGSSDNKMSRINITAGSLYTDGRSWVGAVDWTQSCPGLSGSRGVVCTSDNNVWVANSFANTVTRYDNDGNSVASVAGGAEPYGVTVDLDGKPWVCDGLDEYTYYINPTTNLLGSSPAPKRLYDSIGHAGYMGRSPFALYVPVSSDRMRHGKHFTDQVQQPYRDTQFDTNLTGE